MVPPNDWAIKNCVYAALAVVLATLGLVGLASVGVDIPVLRQIVGFVFLTFIPGILILRIIRVHNIALVEGVVYSIGLSLASVMFTGALLNFSLPYIGISKPMSPVPVTVGLAVLCLVLMAAAYARDRKFVPEKRASRWRPHLASVLFLFLLLLFTVLAVQLVNAYQNNFLLLVCLIIIAATVGLAAFGKFIQPNVYPLAIFVIGLCLLYQTSLMSPYLIGTDIYTEYHFYGLVVSNGFWDATIRSTVNSCLSITILAPVYSLLPNIDGIWVFKAVYPLLFALVPLILFHVFSQQMSQRKAFLAAFFFVIVPTFALEMIGLARQQIAELFLVLVVLLLIDRKLGRGAKITLVTIFAVSIVVSHYATGFIGFIYMGLLLLLVTVIRSSSFRRAWGWVTARTGGLPGSLTSPQALPMKALVVVVLIYFVAGFAWYGIVASGVNLNLLSSLWRSQVGSVVTSGIGNMASQSQPAAYLDFGRRDLLIQAALGLDFGAASLQGKAFRIFQWITQLFLIAGCLRLVFRPRDLRLRAEYIALSVTSVLLMLACIFLPTFARTLNTTRWYHIALITLAPFCILGGEAVWRGLSAMWHKFRRMTVPTCTDDDTRPYLKFVAVGVLVPYFLFTSGLVYEVTGDKVTDKIDTPYSIALSSYRLDLAGVFWWRDGAAAKWLAQNAGSEDNVYGDSHSVKLLKFYDFPGNVTSFPLNRGQIGSGSYIYLTAWNTRKDEMTYTIRGKPGLRQHLGLTDMPGLTEAIGSGSRIYDNGEAQVFASR